MQCMHLASALWARTCIAVAASSVLAMRTRAPLLLIALLESSLQSTTVP